MQVELRPITAIRPYENNPRLNDLAASPMGDHGSFLPLIWRCPLGEQPPT
jgi:hypothetical protein